MRKWIIAVLMLLLLTGCGGDRAADYRFTYRDVEIVMGAEAGPVLYDLGEPVSCTQEPSCAFQGFDTTYYHGGIYLTTYTQEGREYILRAWFADDTVATAQGLTIGMSRDRAEELYGGDLWDQAELEGETSRLIITLEDDTVTGICYEAVFE